MKVEANLFFRMLLQIKIYLFGVMYFFGAVFMLLFPPRNYEMSGSKIRTVRSVNAFQFDHYVDQNTLLAVAKRIAKEASEVAKVTYLTPQTSQNNTIVAFELRSDKQSKKPGILIVGALNAMAWGAPNAILELAEKLLYDSNYQTPFFNDYDWFLIPMANPDGLHFSKSLRYYPPVETKLWSKNLTARKNTRPMQWYKNVDQEMTDLCFGTNINRNFAFHWQDDVYKTPERCSQHYPGAKPFSTAEAKAIRTYIHQLGDVIHLAINLHASYVPKKEFILYPWRYSLRQPSNYRTLQAIGEYAARKARLPDGRLYEVHQSSNDERVAGTLSDYIAGVLGTELVYLIRPYHEPFPDYKNKETLDTYVRKSLSAILALVRGWRSSNKQNTLSFFGRDIEF